MRARILFHFIKLNMSPPEVSISFCPGADPAGAGFAEGSVEGSAEGWIDGLAAGSDELCLLFMLLYVVWWYLPRPIVFLALQMPCTHWAKQLIISGRICMPANMFKTVWGTLMSKSKSLPLMDH